MKKKVRIYKAPDGKGKYMNKTSKFLAKAQMGGTPDPSMLGYPGSQPTQQEDQTNQLIQFIAGDITSKVPKEKTLFQLVNVMGLAVDAATQLYMTIAEKITEDIEREDDRVYEEETGQPRQKDEPLSKDAIITQNPEKDIDYDLNDDTGSDIAMGDVDQGPDILDEALDPLAEQRYGGITKNKYQVGGEYSVALPDPDAYSSLVESMNGYDLVSQTAWNSDEDTTSPYLNKQYANNTMNYTNLQNGGVYKKAKKKYVNSVMNLLKKQMGGTGESDINPNQGDPTGANFREGKLKAFTNTVKKDAQMSAMQNQLEQQYDQMMQEGGMTMPEQDVENPMHHLQLYSQAASGIFGDPMNETVKAKDGLSVGAGVPKGFYKRTMKRFGNIPNLREVDVRKSGIFGPKQYTMYFDPSPLQQLSNPVTAEMYGYGSSNVAPKKQIRTFDATETYSNLAADVVNKEALKEVDKSTPDSEATTVKEEVNKIIETPSTTTASQLRPAPITVNAPTTAVTSNVTVDEWGRPSTSKWYGFNPKTNTWDSKYTTHRNMFDPTPGITNIARGVASYKEPSYITAFRNQTDNTLNSLLFKQTGGIIENPFSNPMEPLQRFVGGGYDPSMTDLSEDQIQYMDSKDVTDAYMQGGGFIKNFIPANLTRSSRNDVVQRVYNPLTGETRQGGPGAGNYISAIDVRKRGITGTPKKYTIYYGAQGDPRYENLITLDGAKGAKGAEDKGAKAVEKSERQQALENAGYGQRTDVTGLKAKSKAAIRKGERQRDRELEKLYKEDPTNVEFDPIDLEALPDRNVSNTSAYNFNDITYPTTEEEFATWGIPKDAAETFAYQFPEVDYNDDVAWGIAGQPITQVNAYSFPEGEINDAAFGVPQDATPIRQFTSDFAPMGLEGPLATEEDQVPTFEEQYMEGYQPTITQDMIDEASGLRMPQQPVDMGAWSGMAYPGIPFEPGVNPFDLPVGGGQDYYSPFAQPVAPTSISPSTSPSIPVVQVPSGPTLSQLRNQQRSNPNYGQKYNYKFDTAAAQQDPDYKAAMQRARKDGVVTNEEASNALRAYSQKAAEQEKAKIASQAQRTINQIMSSNASAAEKRKAKERVMTQMQERWDLIDSSIPSRKYGGGLSRFVDGGGNQPFTGENPVAYTNNPAMQGKSDLDLISLNQGIQGAQGQVDWASMASSPANATYRGPQAPEIKIDPMQQEEYQVAKTYSEPLAVDVKNKLTQGEREARLIAGNALMRGVAGFKNRIDDTKQMEGFYDNLTADNLYASDPSRDRGDYAESGLYRPDEQGQTWYGRSAQMGGYVEDEFEDGEEVYMTDEEIQEYMANGGQIEFI